MSKQIEERVLQMKFDNDQFEDGAHQTINTLDQLETSLKFEGLANSLDKVEKTLSGFNFGNITGKITGFVKSLDPLSLMGARTIENIADDVYRFTKNTIAGFSGWNNVTAGWSKYGEEVANVQTIMNATGESEEEVYRQLEKLAWFTDETSYNYDAMTANIAKFNAAGVKLDPALKAMIGIADMAGYFGVEANNATHAMEGFSKAIGAGYMSASNWKWIQTARMETEGVRKAFIDAAIAEGTLKKVGDDTFETLKGNTFSLSSFTQELKDGWLDTNTMLRAFNTYGGATEEIFKEWEKSGGQTSEIIDRMRGSLDALGVKAFESAQSALTFKQAIESVNVAVASKWRKSFQIIFGEYSEAKRIWTNVANELWDVFASGGDRRNDILSNWAENGGRSAILDGVANLWDGFSTVLWAYRDRWAELFPVEEVADRLVQLSEYFRNFTETLLRIFPVDAMAEKAVAFADTIGSITKPILDFFFKPFVKKAPPIMETITELQEVCEEVYGPVHRTAEVLDDLAWQVIRGDYGNGQTRIDLLRDLGYSFELVQNRVNELLGVSYRYEVQQDGFTKKMVEVTKTVEKKNTADHTMLENMQQFLDGEPIQERRLRYLSQAFEGIVAAGKLAGKVFEFVAKSLLEAGQKIGKRVVPWIDELIKTAGIAGKNFSNFVDNFSVPDAVVKGWSLLTDAIAAVVGFLSEMGAKAIEFIRENFGKALQWVTAQFTSFWNVVSKSKSLDRLIEKLGDLWEFVKDLGGKAAKKIEEFFRAFTGEVGNIDVGTLLGKFVEFAMDRLSDLIDALLNAKEIAKDFFSQFKGPQIDALNSLSTSISNINLGVDANIVEPLEKASEYLDKFWQWLQSIYSNLKNPFKPLGDWAKSIGDTFSNFIENLDYEKLSNILKTSGLGALFFAFAEKIHNGGTSIASIPSNFNLVLISLKDVLIDYQKKLNANFLLDAAKALGIFALSMIALTSVPIQKLMDVTSVMVIAAGAIAGLAKAFAAWNNSKANLKKAENGGLLGDVFKGFIGDSTLLKVISTIISPFTNFADKLAASIDKKLNAGNTSKAFLAIAAALGILIFDVLTVLDKIDFERDQEKINNAVILIGALAGMMAAAIKIANWGNGASMGSAIGFVAIAFMIKELVNVVDYILTWDTGKIGKAAVVVLTLGVFIGLLAAGLRSLTETTKKEAGENSSKSSKTSHPLIKFALSVLLIALALDLMMPAITTMANFDVSQINKVWGVVIAIGALMGVMTWLTKLLAEQKDSDKAAKSLGKIGAVVAGLMIVMTIMGALNVNVLPGIIAMGAAIGILVAAIWAIDSIGATDTLIKFGEGIANFGKGLLAAVAGIVLFCTFLPQIVDGIIALGEALQNETTRNALIAGVVALIGVLIGAILLTKTDIISAMITLVNEVVNFLPSVFAKIGITIIQSWPLIAWFISTLIFLLLAFIESILPGTVDRLCSLLVTAIKSLAHAIATHGPELVGAFAKVILGIFYGIIGTLIDALGLLFPDVAKFLKEGLNAVIEKDLGGDTSSVDVAGDNYSKAIRNQKPKIDEALQSLGDTTSNPMNNVLQDMQMTADQIGIEIPEELNQYGENFGFSGQFLTDSLMGPMEGIPGDMSSIANSGIDWFTTKVDEGQEKINAAADRLNGGFRAHMDMSYEMAGIAQAAVNGFVNTLNLPENLNAIGAAGLAMANTLKTAVASVKGLNEHSPSKAMAKLGDFAVVGFVDMIYDRIGLVKDAGIRMATSLTSAIDTAMDLANTDMEYTPRITPVVDLSYAQNSASSLRTMFGDNRGRTLAAGFKFRTRAEDIQESVDTAVGNMANDLYSAINDRDVNAEYVFEAPVSIDGREVARASARYTKQELDLINRNNNRKGGKVR